MYKYFPLFFLVPGITTATPEPMAQHGYNIVSINNSAYPDEFKRDILSRLHEIETKGYHEEESSYPAYFLTLKDESKKEIWAYKDINDTHLKAKVTDMKLAFSFKPLTPIADKDIIGYAPLGSYIGDGKPGWTGIKAFFTNDLIGGTCAYSYFNLALSHGGVEFYTEITKSLVNGKPSAIDVLGSPKSGFVYTIDWTDKVNFFELECATVKYDRFVLANMIHLASEIDKR